MIALVSAALAIAALAIAALLLRRLGTGYRIARLLGATPSVSLAEAAEAASRGERRYLRVTGRVSSDEEFPDENERPLVFRRVRLDRIDARRGWAPISDERQAVPFGVEDRTSFIAVDADALGDGLVVVPRESTGRASDLPQAVAAGLRVALDPDTAVRLRVDQVSAVEHATVAGVAIAGPEGPLMTAGAGRPLIVSTVEPPVAMRLLAGDRRSTVVAAALSMVVGLGAAAVSIVAFAAGW